MKFILIERCLPESGIEELIEFIGIIFPNNFAHVRVYNNFLETIIEHRGDDRCKVVSAGDYSIHNRKFSGYSSTINVKCHPKTSEVFEMIDYQAIQSKENSLTNV